MLDDLLQVVNHALEQGGPWQGKTILLAFSGGMDSTVLLEALTLLRPRHGYELHAAHIHHGLQPIADQWPAHCEQQALQRGVSFHIKKVQLQQFEGLGLEGAARLVRYQALGAIPADVVVLGHHLDDQAESVLLQLLRGAGPAGLSGMGADSTPSGHPLQTPILRPLLSVPRKRIALWAKDRGLSWIEDPSNQSLQMDRNYVRNRLGPALNERFRSWQQGLARSAQWAAEAQSLLVELAHQDLHAILCDAGSPTIPASPQSDPAWLPGHQRSYLVLKEHRLRNLLRVLVAERGAPAPPAPRLVEWIRQLQEADADRAPTMIWQDWVLRSWGGKLWLEKRVRTVRTQNPDAVICPDFIDAEGTEARSLEWNGLQPLHADWPAGGGVDIVRVEAGSLDQIQAGLLLPFVLRHDCGPLTIKTASGGARIQPSAMQPHRNLRKLFQELRVPPWRRARMPMLHCGRELIAVPGVAVHPAWQAPLGSAGWQLIWRDAGLACYNN